MQESFHSGSKTNLILYPDGPMSGSLSGGGLDWERIKRADILNQEPGKKNLILNFSIHGFFHSRVINDALVRHCNSRVGETELVAIEVTFITVLFSHLGDAFIQSVFVYIFWDIRHSGAGIGVRASLLNGAYR